MSRINMYAHLLSRLPPERFQHTNESKKMIECLLNINELKSADDNDRFIQEVFDIMGPVTPINNWMTRYRSLWIRIISEAIKEKGIDITIYTVLPFYLKIAESILSHTPELSQTTIKDIMAKLDDKVLYAICCWNAHGRKNYTVSRGLAQKLAQTRLKGYPAKDLNLPYGAIFIDLTSFGDGYAGCIAIQQEGSITVFTTPPTDDNDDYVSLTIFKNDVTLDVSIDGMLNALPKEQQQFAPLWKNTLIYVINAVLYATMPDAEQTFQYYDPTYTKLKNRLNKQKSPKKREKIKQQLKKTNREGHIVLGGSIIVDRTEEQEPSQGFKGMRRITVRTLVSGHWRNQPCGWERRETKRIWIEPHWRGPEGAPITQKRHHLQ
jgi:hypothetical protein